MHLSVRFSTEKELKQFQDLLYEKSGQGVSFTGLLEAMVSEVTIVTAVHNIKSNKGSKTAGVDRMKMDKYLQMPKEELFQLIQSNISNYKPKPAKRKYIEKANGKKRPLGIPTVLDRIIQECMRLILEPICEARFYPHSYGFRPYRAQKHAIRDIVNVINASVKSKDQPVWAVEGDIKGCFDNINHRLLLKKLWRIGIHDKRVLKIISQMLKAGYIDQDLYHATEMGTPQGGILSPLLSNVYLNDFDWYVGRCYMEPHRQCKHKCNDTRRLKWSGITPKYNFRYADDWVILTSTEQEAFRMKHELTKYFKHRMKLELSQEKTYVTDLRKNGIHFLGYIVKAERKRKTPDPATWSDNLVGKPFPDMERLTKKIHTLQKEVRKIGLYTQSNTQAAQIQYVNSVIMGLAQYLQPSICSHAYHAIDRRVNNTALAVWKNLFPKQYNQMQVPLKELSNLPHRHEGYDSKTFAIQIDGKWFGITYAFITHSRYESKPFDQKMTPYTEDGRRRYVNYRTKHKPLPCDRPSINTPEDIALSIYASGKGWRANFEYFMNREYAYNRDKGKCKCCGRYFSELIPKHCHHVNPRLPIERINKVPNLAWLCIPCSAACLAMQGLSDSYVFYGYVDQLLLGEELSKRGVWPVLDYFAQDAQLGLGVQLWVVRGGTAAQAVQAGGESGVENRLSTLQTDSEMGAAGASRTAGEVFSDLLERGSAYLPALRVQETDQEGQTALLEAGYAVLKNGVLAGYLEGESAKGLELLVNQVPSDVLEVPLSQGRVVVRVTGSALVCTPRIENGTLAAVDLNCRVTAEVAEIEGELTQEDLEQVKQAIDSRQQRRITQALERLQSWGTDCVGLGQRLAMADPARGEKLLEQWPEVFSSLPVQVSVETSLTRLLFMEES